MAEIIDFTRLMDILPEDGRITITFMRQKDGTIGMVYAPRYDGLASDDAAVVNGDIPFWGTPEQLQSTVPGRIAEIARESLEYIAVAGTKKPETAADRIRQARERKIKERITTGTAPREGTAGQADRHPATGNVETLTPREMELIPGLPEKVASVMRMRFVEGRTLQDIGDAIGKTKQTVQLRIKKGRRLLIHLMAMDAARAPLAATTKHVQMDNADEQGQPDKQHPAPEEVPEDISNEEKELIPLLPPKIVEVMHMHFIEGRSPQEIANATGNTRQTVQLRIGSGRKMLAAMAAQARKATTKPQDTSSHPPAPQQPGPDEFPRGSEIRCGSCKKTYLASKPQRTHSICPYCYHRNEIRHREATTDLPNPARRRGRPPKKKPGE